MERAEIFLRNDIKTFIKDVYGNYHFCFIKEIAKEWIIVKNFEGNRAGEKVRILLIDIEVLKEYKERGDGL